MAFTQGVSGLNAASSQLDTIGHNIANSQTVGYKKSRTEFADLYAGAKAGLGVQVSGITQGFAQGALETTDRDLDLAIDGGGFFRLTDGQQVTYSRNGQFQMDSNGFLVNNTGGKLTGYPVDDPTSANPTVLAGAQPVAIQVAQGDLDASATTSGSMTFNLNSTDTAKLNASGQAIAFDSKNPKSYNWQTSLTTYDSQGNAQQINMYFVKSTTSNSWDVHAMRNGVEVNGNYNAYGANLSNVGARPSQNYLAENATSTNNAKITGINISDAAGIPKNSKNPEGQNLTVTYAAGENDEPGTYTLSKDGKDIGEPVTAKDGQIKFSNGISLAISEEPQENGSITLEYKSIPEIPEASVAIDNKNDPNFGQNLKVNFNENGAYSIIDEQGTEVSNGIYNDNDTITYAGLSMKLTSVPAEGDSFSLTPRSQLAFNENGKLTGGDTLNLSFDPGNGAAPIDANIDLSNVTQNSGSFVVKAAGQDGYSAGSLTGISIADNGDVMGKYSNNQSRALGRVALASFTNEQGLKPDGNNAWLATTDSGQELLGSAGTGQLGSLLSGTLENSNVDLASELVTMIVAQRNYQANAQTIKTQDQILQTMVNLR